MQQNVVCKWADCDKIFDTQRQCLNHLRTSHQMRTSSGDCLWGRCDFSTRVMGSLRNHVKRHFELTEAVCTVCSIERFFKWRFDLGKHIKVFHENCDVTVESISVEGFSVHVARPPKYPAFLVNILN